MLSRSFTLVLVSLFVLSGLPQEAAAQDQSPRWGTINADNVYVRSGPGDNHYPTMKLQKGAKVQVVGMHHKWLKVVPPEGSFSYIGKAFVERRGTGNVGRVTGENVNVRAGSQLNPMKVYVQTKLSTGTDVEIMGEEDEYYKIKPPAEALAYVAEQFVTPGEPVQGAVAAEKPVTPKPVADAPATDAPAIAEAEQADPAPATQPAEAAAEAPATQPTSAEAAFDQLEADWAQANNLPIEQQPIGELRQRYEALSASADLPHSMRRIAESRVATLDARKQSQEQLAEFRKMQEQVKQRQVAQKAEQEELAERIRENDVQVFTAVGTLQTSSLQVGEGSLYRLTDPASGRTVVYVRSEDPKYLSLLGQFIGVRGEVQADPQVRLDVLTPTEVEKVDPGQVGSKVYAQIIPPSLLTKVQASTTSGEE